jgi:UDP-N-acetylmuramyl tripeptide synthase
MREFPPSPAFTNATWQVVQALDIAGVTADSRQVVPGDLFAALPGSLADGRPACRRDRCYWIPSHADAWHRWPRL